MKHSIVYILLLALCLSVSCKSDKKETITEPAETATEVDAEAAKTTKERPDNFDVNKKIIVTLDSKSNSGVTGNVVFTQDKGVVTMIAVLSGLSEGEHAIHLHEKADCSSDDGKSSGGHWNPTGQPHGKWGNASGYHKGDIGNFTANEWCIGCDDDAKNIIGKAIIVHQGVDDFTSQPSGAAGTRVSCGGIIQ